MDINLLDNFNQYHSFNYDDFEENLSDNNNENAEILSGENEIESSNNYDENEEFFLDVSEKSAENLSDADDESGGYLLHNSDENTDNLLTDNSDENTKNISDIYNESEENLGDSNEDILSDDNDENIEKASKQYQNNQLKRKKRSLPEFFGGLLRAFGGVLNIGGNVVGELAVQIFAGPAKVLMDTLDTASNLLPPVTLELPQVRGLSGGLLIGSGIVVVTVSGRA